MPGTPQPRPDRLYTSLPSGLYTVWKHKELKGHTACKGPTQVSAHAKGTCIFVHFQCILPRLLVGPGEGGKWWELPGNPNENPSRGVWRPSRFLWLNMPKQMPPFIMPWSSPCPGFDLPIQSPGVPSARLPGSSWPRGTVTVSGRVTPARERDTPQTRLQALPHLCRINTTHKLVSSSPPWGGGRGEREIPWASIPWNS